MRKLLTVLFIVVLIWLCAFSAFAVDDSTDNIEAQVDLCSGCEMLSSKFSVCYDSSVAKLTGISCSDFYIEMSESDGVVDVVFASKDNKGVANPNFSFEFDRLTEGELLFSVDSVSYVDVSKCENSLSSDNITIALTENKSADNITTEEVDLSVSAGKLVVNRDFALKMNIVFLTVCVMVIVFFIVKLKIKEQKELRDSK